VDRVPGRTWLKWLKRFGFGFQDRFVRGFRAHCSETLEFLKGAAVKALGLGLVAIDRRTFSPLGNLRLASSRSPPLALPE
jgi:hypothetical protein